MFHYLIGVKKKQPLGELVTCSYRLSRIYSPVIRQETIIIPPTISNYLDRMERHAPQFKINDDIETCVRLTDAGQTLYDRIYFGRPAYDRTEDGDGFHYYYFHTSIDQLSLYFRRFPGRDAVVLYPEKLRTRIIQFHKESLNAYEC